MTPNNSEFLLLPADNNYCAKFLFQILKMKYDKRIKLIFNTGKFEFFIPNPPKTFVHFKLKHVMS